MGITIDESVENLMLLKKLEDSLGNISGNTNSVASQSLGCAIDIMRKYQKIEEIMSVDLEYIHPLYRDKYRVVAIKEVMNGNDK